MIFKIQIEKLYKQVKLMKLQSRIIIRIYLICAVVLLLLAAIIITIGEQTSKDKIYILILFGSIALFCFFGMIFEIKHYVIFKNQSVIVKNRFKVDEILLKDLQKIEIYEPIQEDSRYLSIYNNKIIFKTVEKTIKFVFYTFHRKDIKKELSNIFNKNYIGKVINKKSDRKNQVLYELIACIIISIISVIGIIFFSINYSWYLFLCIGMFLLGGGLSYYYYLKLKRK